MASSCKRIIICCDGTYDDFGDTIKRKQPGSHISRILRWLLPPFLYHLLWGLRVFKLIKRVERKLLGAQTPQKPFRSNISHLASAVKPCAGDGVHQVVIYVGGIGALGTPQSRFEEAVTGNTMDYKIRYVYRVIVDNYVHGDEVLLFGYSRGAFTVRAVVGFIEWAGILKKSNMPCFDAVWHAYTGRLGSPDDQTGSQTKQERMASIVRDVGGDNANGSCVHPDPKIRCVGVFDTVGSLKAPPLWLNTTDDIEIARKARKRYDGLNIDLDEVENVFQALALDERRFDFYPSVLARSSSNRQNFKQTWFAGVHADMGGRNSTPLGLFPLIWMVSKLQEAKLLDFDDDYIRRNVLNPVIKTDSKPNLESIRLSHFIDRHPILRRLLPGRFLPWFRYAHRNPNMPAGTAIAHSDPPSSDPNSDGQSVDRTATEEQMFHWTVIDRLIGGRGRYWELPPRPRLRFGWHYEFFGLLDLPLHIVDLHMNNPQSCVALRKPKPLDPNKGISVADIKARMDRPTDIDDEVFTHFQEKKKKDDCVIL